MSPRWFDYALAIVFGIVITFVVVVAITSTL